jgi:hypothetical protein
VNAVGRNNVFVLRIIGHKQFAGMNLEILNVYDKRSVVENLEYGCKDPLY